MNVHKIIALMLGIILIFAIGGVMKITQSVFLPLIIALLFMYILDPLINGLTKVKIPRIIAIIIVLMIIFGVLYLVALFLYSSVNSLIREFPKYQRKIQFLIDQIGILLGDRLPVSIRLFDDINWGLSIRGYLISISESFVGFISKLFMVIIFLIFLLLEKPYLKTKLAMAFQSNMNTRIDKMLEHINDQIGRYLIIKLLISLLTGLLFYVSFLIIGLDFALIFGILAVLFNFIPSIGSILITLLTILMSFVQFYPSWPPIIAVIICTNVIQTLVGNILDPKVSGDRLNLSPFLVIFSLMFWGWLWGIIGMFLAVPLTVVVKIIFENIPALRPVSIIMGTGKERKERKKREGSPDCETPPGQA